MEQLLILSAIKDLNPNEWVLVGNPIMDENKIDVLHGILLFHGQDKKEVCCMERDKTSNFDKIALMCMGTFKPALKITVIFNRLSK